MNRFRLKYSCAVVGLLIPALSARAEQLGRAKLRVTALGAGGDVTKAVTDNDPGTLVSLQANELGGTPPGLRIDLGRSFVVHRVFLRGGRARLRYWPRQYEDRERPPQGLVVVYVGDAADTGTQVAEFTVPYDAGDPVDDEVDVRCRPAAGRYVRIELQTEVVWGRQHWPGHDLKTQPPPPPADVAWNVAEIELYGFAGADARAGADAVVLPKDAAQPLALAANELGYYLGELTGKPHPVIVEEEIGHYPGTLYRILDLKPLAPTYDEMARNMRDGRLPTHVNVERRGREVLFRAWPYRCVLWSVWEFLERQGVRWLYPDAHGDFVPTGKGIDLGILPLRFKPSARSIYANWDAGALQPWPPWMRQSLRQGYLYPWRNRWNSSWNAGVLGGAEIPARAVPAATLKDEYKEGFDGYPHNFNSVVPDRILRAHPDWYGYSRGTGKRAPGPAFCMSNPELTAWVADKMAVVARARPAAARQPLELRHHQWAYNLLPMDGTSYCECEKCLALNGPPRPSAVAWVAPFGRCMSDVYYRFVCDVAKDVAPRNPDVLVGALAYAEVFPPPDTIERFPDNTQIEVCLYGAPNLPMGSRRNAALRQAWEFWRTKCSRLTTYDYALLHTDHWQKDPRLPVPLVTATVDRAKFLHRLGALDGGCQATPESLPYNPWNFYAYPRIRWNVEQNAEELLREFFTGYYREASGPMLAYYKALEDHLIHNDVSLYYMGYCYGITPGSFPIAVLAEMKRHLAEAKRLAKSWVVAERVARAQEGLDWVIEQRGLKGVDLNDVSRYPRVEASEIRIDLKALRKPTRAAGNFAGLDDRTGEWTFWAQSAIESPLRFGKAGTYAITVAARGVPYQDVWPVMNVFVGAKTRSFTVDTKENREFSFAAEVRAGVQDLMITFDNAAEGGRRNVIIKEIRIVRQGGSSARQ